MPKNPLDLTFPEVDSHDLSNIRMLGEHILLRVYPQKEETKGGLVLTEGSQDRRCVAWVLAVGPGVDDLIMVGDSVMCPHSGLRQTITELDEHNTIVYILQNDVVVHYPKNRVLPNPKHLRPAGTEVIE